MNISNLKNILVFIIGSLAGPVQAQLYLEDFNLYPDEALYKRIHDNPDINEYYPFIDGHGHYPNLAEHKQFPKKIAIVSFYVWDNLLIEDKKSPAVLWSESSWIISDSSNRLANEFSKYSVGALKHRFDSLGSVVIVPADFTREQKATYDSMQIHYLSSYRKRIPDSIHYEECSSAQFRFIKMPVQKLDYKFSNDMALLAKVLNVDAVLIVENHVKYKNGVSAILQKIVVNMYGPNPVPTPPASNRIKGKEHYAGMLYVSMEMELEALFTQYDDTKYITYESYLEYDRIMMLITDQLYLAFVKRTEITPKKS